jgi:hypothetical protein
LRRPARRREDEYASGRVAPVGACGTLRQEGQGTLRVRGAFFSVGGTAPTGATR